MKSIVINSKVLVKLFESKKFLKALEATARRTYDTGHLTKFEVLVDSKGKMFITQVKDTSSPESKDVKTLPGFKDDYGPLLTAKVLDINFDVSDHGPVEPLSVSVSLLHDSAFVATGKVWRNGSVSMLLIRKSSPAIAIEPYPTKRYDELVKFFDSQKEITKTLETFGCSSIVIDFGCLGTLTCPDGLEKRLRAFTASVDVPETIEECPDEGAEE